ncbi:hypothetical protein B1L04_20840 [Microcystis aeruginosa KW]|uniref:Uncharacterized protein n=1 Tax=Microcystis aeruginosa KW TaxID=1960155 RepID=A0A1V4BLY4_MICAE|nr:hypothetical protein [Microcystis aeruginosa]OPF15015.1 hypothetical protein B1L04_20840 [Microcystis aeruginosa KW]
MTNSNQPGSNSTWEKIVAIFLATVVLGTFIFYVFNPPPTADATLALIRFLAAAFSGLAAFLFVGDLNLEGTIPGLDNKVKVKAAGGFAAFLLVFVLFFYGIKPSEDSNLPNSQPLTLWGSYPTLALFDPTQPTIPDILTKELELDKNPIIFQKSPVFDSIQTFIKETGNQDFISNLKQINQINPLQTSVNYKNQTKNSNSNETANQSQGQFEQDGLIQEGKDAIARAEYNPILLEFSNKLQEAPWTATLFSEDTFDTPVIFQYPQLADIGKSTLKAKDFGFSDDLWGTNNTWITKVIQANPQQRGLVGYQYQFITDLSQNNLLPGGCTGFKMVIDTDLFMPYVKLIDIWNSSEKPIPLNSITYKIANKEANPYKLSDATERSKLFKSATNTTDNINVILQPKRHYLIPIEFGFMFDQERKSSVENLSQNLIYIPKPLPKDIELTFGSSVEEIKKYNQKITQSINLSNDFLNQIKTNKNDIDVPRKLAIGSVINVESMIVNQRKIFIPKPGDEFSSSIAQGLGLGSCPYLLVYDTGKGYWLDLGTVLYSRASQDLQDTEIHALGNQTTKIKLQERENEITYLDYIAILYTEYDTGIHREITPNIFSITKIDGQYLVLNKGQNLEIDLSNLIPANATAIQLKINGYYTRI